MIQDDNPQIKVKTVDYIDRQVDNSIVCFIRNYVYDECGDYERFFDINLDGTPYIVTGTIEKADSGNITNNILDVTALETITQIVDNNDGTFTYTNESGTPVTVTAGAQSIITNTVTGNRIATHDDGTSNTIDINETITSLTIVGNILNFTDESGTVTPIDLSVYIDDTNLARLVAGSVDAAGIATFTRDDTTTFTVDFSTLFDDTNLARITSGSVVGTNLVLNRDDTTSITIDINSLINHTHLIADILDASTVAATNDYNDLDNLPTIPTAAVDSVNGLTGVVVLTPTDLGLGNVDNTSDANKPVSIAQQTEIDTKADINHTHLEADITDLDKYTQAEIDAQQLLQDNRLDALENGTCEVVVISRAALILQRNAGTLNTCATYKVAVTQVTGTGSVYIRALDVDVLDSNISWEEATLTNGTAWAAYYDIDANEFSMLHDPVLNNTVYGEAAIAAFPWGNTSLNDNYINTATFNYTAGIFNNNRIESLAVVNVNGGNVLRNTFEGLSLTTINSGDFKNNKIQGDATVTSDSTLDVDYNDFRNFSTTTISGASNVDYNDFRTGADTIITDGTVSYGIVGANSNYTHNGGIHSEFVVDGDCNVTMSSGNNFENYFGQSATFTQVGTGFVRYSSFTGNLAWVNGDVDLSSVTSHLGNINTTGSTGTISNTSFDRPSAAGLQNIPDLTISNSSFDSLSTLICTDADLIDITDFSMSSESRVLVSAGTRLVSTRTNLDSYGYIQVLQGSLSANQCSITSAGYLQQNSTGSNTVFRTTVSDLSFIRFRDTATGNRVYYTACTGGSYCDIYGTSSNNYIYYSQTSGRGQILINNSTAGRIYYCTADSLGKITSTSNASSHLIYQSNASSNGTLSMINSGGSRIFSCDANSQAILRLQNSSGNLYYSSVTAYYYLYVTLTAAVTRSALHAYGRRTYTVTDPPNGTFTQNF